MSTGIYVAFIEKWLEHFSLKQFYVVRLEDYHKDPARYMKNILSFLNLRVDIDMSSMLTEKVYNQHRADRPDMFSETEKLLREFYQPYNDLLAKLLRSESFRWLDGPQEERKANVASQGFTEKVSLLTEKKKVLENLPSARDSFNAVKKYFDGNRWNEAKPFSLEGLAMPDPDAELNIMSRRYVNPKAKPTNIEDAGKQLCIAVASMDLLAVKTMLVDHGISGDITLKSEHNRNAFHCLSVLNINTDGHSKSHIFHLLQGEEGYLTNIFDPPLPLRMNNTISNDIVMSLEPVVIKIAKWLLRAGADPKLPDDYGITPLHYSTIAGSLILTKFLLENGADPNAM